MDEWVDSFSIAIDTESEVPLIRRRQNFITPVKSLIVPAARKSSRLGAALRQGQTSGNRIESSGAVILPGIETRGPGLSCSSENHA